VQTIKELPYTPLQLAKNQVAIPDLWLARGWDGIPPREGKACRFPDGTDHNPSASLLRGGRLLYDHRNGKTYNSINLLMEVEQVGRSEACRILIEIARTRNSISSNPQIRCQAHPQVREKPTFPSFDIPTGEEISHLSKQRLITPIALELASKRGFLRSWNSSEGKVWVLTDSSGWIAVARRMDGRGWVHHNGSKAKMLKGSMASWPIGVRESVPFPAVAICEGGPDMLACLHFLIGSQKDDHVAPICMGSAGCHIPQDALELLRGKRVRIFIDNDARGRHASTNWAKQLINVGCKVDGFDFSGLMKRDGNLVKDLNDCTQLSDESIARYGELLSGMMDLLPKSHKPQPKPNPFLPKLTSCGYWSREELAVIKGTELEEDALFERLAKMLGGRILTHQVHQLTPLELYLRRGVSV